MSSALDEIKIETESLLERDKMLTNGWPYREKLSQVRELALDIGDFFEQKAKQTQVTEKFGQLCADITKNAGELQRNLDAIATVAPFFDLDESLPWNGFRSLIAVADRLFDHLMRIFDDINVKKDSWFFKSQATLKELEAYVAVFLGLNSIYSTAINTIKEWPHGELLPLSKNPATYAQGIHDIEELQLDCFFGRVVGFQFCEPVQKWFQFFNRLFAIYYARRITSGSRVLTLIRLLRDQEEIGKTKVRCTRERDIAYNRGFWDIGERSTIIKAISHLGMVKVAVNDIIYMPGDSPLYVMGKKGKTVEIPAPDAGSGHMKIPVRLVSYRKRIGMKDKTSGLPPSECLILHIHGGGFVANTSSSHQGYLRSWARRLQIPIASLDYSLAPEHPYPRAIQEAVYFYAWVLNNPEKLGWTGERIIFVGDSAGGNLCTTTCLMALEMGFGRLPDGMVLFFPAMCVQFYPAPARLLAFMDPLIPYQNLIRCLAAYYGYQNLDDSPSVGIDDPMQKIREIRPYTHDMCLSPLGADFELLRQLPPIFIETGDLDPTLDDSITFAKHVREAGGQITLDVSSAIPHGFILHTAASPECKKAERLAVQRMRTLLKMHQD